MIVKKVLSTIPALFLLVNCSALGTTFDSDNNHTASEPSISSDQSCQTSYSTRSENDTQTSSFSDFVTDDSDSFIFFTDPHLFQPNNSFSINQQWLDDNIPFLQQVYNETSSNFIMCGGDLLNNFDTINQACFKINYFVESFRKAFDSFHIIVGNHDTNYQGESYMLYHDYSSCILSNEALSECMFGGQETYYSFETENAKYYCFNSGIEDEDNIMTEFKWEQIDWFAKGLIDNAKKHISIFIHIALNSKKEITAFMENIGKVVHAFNNKESLELNNIIYDYSSSIGRVDFVQAGHEHSDSLSNLCDNVPIIITTNYSFDRPTFDHVFINYEKSTISCSRFGSGENRTINFN